MAERNTLLLIIGDTLQKKNSAIFKIQTSETIFLDNFKIDDVQNLIWDKYMYLNHKYLKYYYNLFAHYYQIFLKTSWKSSCLIELGIPKDWEIDMIMLVFQNGVLSYNVDVIWKNTREETL